MTGPSWTVCHMSSTSAPVLNHCEMNHHQLKGSCLSVPAHHHMVSNHGLAVIIIFIIIFIIVTVAIIVITYYHHFHPDKQNTKFIMLMTFLEEFYLLICINFSEYLDFQCFHRCDLESYIRYLALKKYYSLANSQLYQN